MNEPNQYLGAPLVGKKLPDLRLDVLAGGKIGQMDLSSTRGKWLVLFFYPGDFTFVCPTELKELAALYPEFQAQNAEVMSVSCDTVYSHFAWHDTSPAVKTVQFPMIADQTGVLSKTLGVYVENGGMTLRASFIIDPHGVIKAMEMNDNSIGRSAAELLRKLQASKYVAEHKNEVCPASWHPGEQTLKPGTDLVGKI